MNERELHLKHLRAAEGQFRLSTAVRLAVTVGHQPLDLPIQWSHGRHVVNYSEIALSNEEADFAAWNLQRSATFLMASAVLEAVRGTIENPKAHKDSRVVSAYQIARTIRNAFSHSPFNPVWNIDQDCRDRDFQLPNVIHLNCKDLHGRPFDWRHYGGPLAILMLSKFVRRELLADTKEAEKVVPMPQRVYVQQGDLILMKVDEIPADAVRVEAAELPGGGISLGDGHVIGRATKEGEEETSTHFSPVPPQLDQS
jgi:hypothetical protein